MYKTLSDFILRNSYLNDVHYYCKFINDIYILFNRTLLNLSTTPSGLSLLGLSGTNYFVNLQSYLKYLNHDS